MIITILNGDMAKSKSVFSTYLEKLGTKLRENHTVHIYHLDNMKVHYCTGCWSCWWKTPGRCAINDDAIEIFRSYINSDFVIFASPLIAGFTSSKLKQITDRLIVLLHPYFALRNGECHHHKRYDRYPDFGIILEKEGYTGTEDIDIVNAIYNRYALNFHCNRKFTMFNDDDNIIKTIEGLVDPTTDSKLNQNSFKVVGETDIPTILQKNALVQPSDLIANVDIQDDSSMAITKNVAIFNGSPRYKKSNSKILIDHFLTGYNKVCSESVTIHHLANIKGKEEQTTAFQKADMVLLFFPLYTDCMPGIVKAFLEEVMYLKSTGNKKVGFVVQSGFPESIHSAFLVKYLKNWTGRLHYTYLGTVVKGGVEGIQIMPSWMTNKLFSNFQTLGEYVGKYKAFSPEMQMSMMKPYKMSIMRKLIFGAINKTGLTNFYWNSNLKKNNAYTNRFDKPYKSE